MIGITANDSERAQARLEGLQALRLAAAFAVFSLHAVSFVPSQSFLAPHILKYGHMGVPLFYALSAFALMHSTRAYSQSANWAAQFYVKRFFRIAPLFYLMCAITVPVFLADRSISAFELALNLTFLNNLVPQHAYSLVFAGWSVSVEALFYLVFPLVFIFIRSIRTATVALLLSIACALALRPLFDEIPLLIETYGHFAWPTNLPFFLFGVLAFLLSDHLRRVRPARTDNTLQSLAYHSLFAAAAIAALAPLLLYGDQLRAWRRADAILWGAFFAVLCTWLTVRPVRMLGWSVFQFLGERSYSLYLVHVPLILLATPWLSTAQAFLATILGDTLALMLMLILEFASVCLVASVTYALVEKPGMDLGKRFVRILRKNDEKFASPAGPAARDTRA